MGQAFANCWKAVPSEVPSIDLTLTEVCLLSPGKNALGERGKEHGLWGVTFVRGTHLMSLWVFPAYLPHSSSIWASVRQNREDGHTGRPWQGRGTGEILKDRGVEGVGLEAAVPQAGRDRRKQHGDCRRCGF